jgi:hypothetical protein
MIEGLDLDLEDDDDYFIDPDFFEEEVEEVRYCRYCSKVLESEDSTTLFEVVLMILLPFLKKVFPMMVKNTIVAVHVVQNS